MRPKAKKSLGQNFLIDQNIRRKIISACSFKPTDYVLEIGAGCGELTGFIAEKVAGVYALEVDANLLTPLRRNLKEYANIKIIHRDILKFNLPPSFAAGRRIKVLGNIPYYISTPIIERLFRLRRRIDTIFITVQKEFGCRMAASPGSKEYGRFSCFVQYHAQPEVLFHIKKGSFYPVPKVDSSFMKMKIRKKPLLKPAQEALLFKIIRTAFNQRRKTLRNSLKSLLTPDELGSFFSKSRIDKNIRPEDLSLLDFSHLATLKTRGRFCGNSENQKNQGTLLGFQNPEAKTQKRPPVSQKKLLTKALF